VSGRLRLIGYRHSVYTRAARIALNEKNVDFEETEHDPFTGEGVDNPHAFGRVPVLCHGDFTIYETAAITAYVADGGLTARRWSRVARGSGRVRRR